MFQIINHHHQQQRLQLNLIIFECFGDYLSMVSEGFSCTAAGVVDDIVLVYDELSAISMFNNLCCGKNKFIQGL